MQQYFVKGRPENPLTIKDKDTLKHMFQVMRLKADDKVTLVFDDGIKRLARVLNVDSQTFEILQGLEDNVELPVSVTIASGFPKGDKLDWLTQKATELGADAIWAFPADWSVVKWDGKKLAKKEDKLAKIALGAAQQSKRNRLPQVKLFEKKKDLLKQLPDFDKIFLAYEESAKAGELSTLASSLRQSQSGDKLLFIFGPEGGISPQELAEFEKSGAIPVGLGPRIMRAETAPLYALSAVSFYTELLKF
ncbi:16S rRNA (uracil(1498)-N(3))-methyltransferase [Streptococcus downei]|uniref:Ribosomal RNA small subunit methyltransferase E n=1 Tax=Streptococcus downei MFe28 TaxID=764290 RepID=A0A380JBA5_STRDO|nr:16S rRNA (uracil(1498)-N(3))-methyltransferase [Streptococcus downei]EFQ58343.1 RNA methyltransferase, RsmE family [Streptococcus downei F0415]SUN35262.1 ribosomal RNA small subunit methyltransferase E [Streptococcus downei MFe28]